MYRFIVAAHCETAPDDMVVIDTFGERARSRVMNRHDALVTAAWLNQMWIEERI